MHRHSSTNRYRSMPAMLNYQSHLYSVLIKKLVLTSIKAFVTLVVLVFLFHCLLSLAVSVSSFCVFQIPSGPRQTFPFLHSSCNNCRGRKVFLQMHEIDFSPSFKTSLSHVNTEGGVSPNPV